MIEVDGSFGEGGGQILRTTLAMAAVLGKEVRVFNIRAGRGEPGLRPQHLTSARAISEISSASSKGLDVGSTEFVFRPGTLKSGHFRFDVGTAGSITLVLQTLMLVFPFLPGRVEVEITGGTDVKWSPPVDYLRLVTLPTLSEMGYQGTLQVVLRGHYPRGGGLARFVTTASPLLRPLAKHEGGDVENITGISHSVRLPKHVAERQASAASRVLLENGLPTPEIIVDASETPSALGPGSGIVLCAYTRRGAVLGADSLGERGRSAEEVGSAAGMTLVEELESKALLDRHMGDMIVPYAALAEGSSEISVSRVTQHTITNLKVAELVAGVSFNLAGEIGRPGIVRVKGLGLKSENAFVSPKESGWSSHS